MYVTKTKSYSNLISLNEIKEHVKVDESDSSYDAELIRLTKTAIQIAEKFIQADIAPTTCVLEDYDACGYCYDIFDANITVQGVSATTDGTTTAITSYSIRKFNTYTRIVFENWISAEVLNIAYSSGSSTIPLDIIHAAKIKVGELFDADRNGQVANNTKSTQAFERLLSPYINYSA